MRVRCPVLCGGGVFGSLYVSEGVCPLQFCAKADHSVKNKTKNLPLPEINVDVSTFNRELMHLALIQAPIKGFTNAIIFLFFPFNHLWCPCV